MRNLVRISMKDLNSYYNPHILLEIHMSMIELHYPYWRNLVNMLGKDPDTYLVPLRIPVTNPEWPSLCNPSVYTDNDKIRFIIRNVNYILHNSIDPYKYWSSWGPVHYITPQWDNHLRTRNFLCEYTKDSISYNIIDTSENDKEPMWEFVGLEDARLVRWNNHLYAIGVRRDDNTDGHGRMEMMEITEDGKELSRTKIEVSWDRYCEKNWVPIIDMPYHFMRASNPVHIMKINPDDIKDNTVMAEDVVKKDYYDVSDVKGIYNAYWQGETLFRGSSQVIPYKKDKHIAIVHTCELYFNELKRKVAKYLHHVIVWDKDWNIEKISPSFSFNDYHVEFTNGLAYKNKKFYIPFALQDNFSYLITISEKMMDDIVNGKLSNEENPEFLPNAGWYYDDYDGFRWMEKEAEYCMRNKYYQEAYTRYWRMYERSRVFPISREKQITYLMNIMNSLGWGYRDQEVFNIIEELEKLCPDDPEVLLKIADYFSKKDMGGLARTYARKSILSMPKDYNFHLYSDDEYVKMFSNIMGDRWDTCIEYKIFDKITEIDQAL